MGVTTRTGMALGLALAGGFLLAGCGEKTVDSLELESELSNQLGAQAGARPRSVACLDDIEAEAGRKFDCMLTAPNGDQVRVEVTLTNDEGGFQARVPEQ
jgi:hypothetical protein